MSKVLINEMSWTEFRDIMETNDLVIIPVGTTEQHGRHCPLGTDSLVAEKCATMIGERIGAPVAPVFPYGYNPNVTAFPGTVSLDSDLLRRVLFSYAESYVKHGAKRFLFINGHGGNTDTLGMVALDLYEKYGCASFYTQWWVTLPHLNKEWTCADHGGYFETSVMMAVNKDIVDMKQAQVAPVNPLTEEIAYTHGWKYKGATIPVPVGLWSMQKMGNVGVEPFGANEQLGNDMINTYVDYMVGLAHELKKINPADMETLWRVD